MNDGRAVNKNTKQNEQKMSFVIKEVLAILIINSMESIDMSI